MIHLVLHHSVVRSIKRLFNIEFMLCFLCFTTLLFLPQPSSPSEKMAGTVYLRTDRFEVKLEAITFKTRDFESMCKMDFLFPDGKAWARPPIVGLDVMCHPRDPSVILLLLCFGVGCVILRFGYGEALPAAIHRFLADERIHVVGFGIPEKMDLFPFEELGMRKNEVDIGHIAARSLKDPKYKRWELAELAQKVLGVKKMIGLTEASSFERHEQIKCAICQLFITTVIAMGLLGSNGKKKKTEGSPKKTSFLKNLNSLNLLAEGWFNLDKGKKKDKKKVEALSWSGDHRNDKALVFLNSYHDVETGDTNVDNVLVNVECKDGPFADFLADAEIPKDGDYDYQDFYYSKSKKKHASCADLVREETKGEVGDSSFGDSSDDLFGRELSCNNNNNNNNNNNSKKPIKGILKSPSTTLQRWNSFSANYETDPPPSPSTPTPDQMGSVLKRANSKGCNVSFKFQ